jgi:hypothetical protein
MVPVPVKVSGCRDRSWRSADGIEFIVIVVGDVIMGLKGIPFLLSSALMSVLARVTDVKSIPAVFTLKLFRTAVVFFRTDADIGWLKVKVNIGKAGAHWPP